MNHYEPPEVALALQRLAQAIEYSSYIRHGESAARATLSPAVEGALHRARNALEPYGLRVLTSDEHTAEIENLNKETP